MARLAALTFIFSAFALVAAPGAGRAAEACELGSAPPAQSAGGTAAEACDTVAPRVSLVLPIAYQSQLIEPAPPTWAGDWTPYCAAAAALMVMRSFDVFLFGPGALTRTFDVGRAGNTTEDLGLDPDGISHLMRVYGGRGIVHAHAWDVEALDDLIGRLNHRSPVVALTQSGNHAVTVYGYEAVMDGPITALYVADPLNGHVGPVTVEEWFSSPLWMGWRFAAPGPRWQGSYVFVTYRDFR